MQPASQTYGPPTAAGHAAHRTAAPAILRALGRLRDDERLVLSLIYEHGLTVEEAGHVLALAPDATRRLYAQALTALRAPTLARCYA